MGRKSFADQLIALALLDCPLTGGELAFGNSLRDIGVLSQAGLAWWLMGSFGNGVWVECYWCDYWVENPYIIDWIGHPLCDLCVEWHMGEGRFERDAAQLGREHWRGGPYEPCATTRYMSLLPRLRPLGNSDERQALMNDLALPENLYALITSFSCEWHEP